MKRQAMTYHAPAPASPASPIITDPFAVHGGDVLGISRRLKRGIGDFIDYSGNSHVFAKDVTARLVRETPVPFDRYPDSDCVDLAAAIAAHEGIAAPRILVGNGSADLIWLFMAALAPRKVLLLGPMFSEYARVCAAASIPFDTVTPPPDQEFICGGAELRRLYDSDADLAVLCTPNNPAGVTYPNIQELLSVLRVPRLLIDCTYREFLWGTPDYAANSHAAYAAALRAGVALFTLHSFTKFFCCPGIRLGYLLGDESRIRRLKQRRPPWSVSGLAQDLGTAFLSHLDEYRAQLAPLRAACAAQALEIRRMACFNPDHVFEGPSFITAGLLPGASPALLRDKLLDQGLIIRDCDSIPGTPPGFIRFQVRPPVDGEKLLKALGWYAERGF